MEISRSFIDLGVEDPSYFNQWSMNPFDELSAFGDEFFESFQETKIEISNNKRSPSEELTEIDVIDQRAMKTMRTNSFSSSCETDHQQFPTSNYYGINNNQFGGIVVKPEQEIITTMPSNNNNNNNISNVSFHSDDHHVISQECSFGDYESNNNNYGGFKISQGPKRVNTPNAPRLPQVQDHILAERRRREKLSQRFIALSALIPNLKKMDKASVLGDGIKYLKQLKEKVKELEEQARKKSKESVIVVKRHELYADSNTSSCDENSLTSGPFEDSLPEIEARFSDKDVLVRIHCEKKKGVLEKVVTEIEKLHISVINSSFLTFSSAVHITVIARMNADFSMSVNEFMKNLRSGLKSFI